MRERSTKIRLGDFRVRKTNITIKPRDRQANQLPGDTFWRREGPPELIMTSSRQLPGDTIYAKGATIFTHKLTQECLTRGSSPPARLNELMLKSTTLAHLVIEDIHGQNSCRLSSRNQPVMIVHPEVASGEVDHSYIVGVRTLPQRR